MNIEKKKTHQQQGFTLIEMAIVLAVIGLILGAVSIGKDVQRDAEYTKVKQKFIDGWAQAYNAYYQRTGVVLGDSQVKPQIMVNGAAWVANASFVASGGNNSTAAAALPGAICSSTTTPQGLTNGTTTTSATVATGTLFSLFDQAGVRMPPGRAEGLEDRYVYLDSNGNPQEIQVCFQWNKPGVTANAGNVMVITGLTPDLARSLDQMIDGKPDAREGMFRQQNVAGTASGGAGLEWNTDNTKQHGTGTNVNFDESQVRVVVAYYKMNQ